MIASLNFLAVCEIILTDLWRVYLWLIMTKKCSIVLEMMFAVVVKGKRAVRKYFEETGVDMTGEDIMQASEVFDVGDGRYLIVEG